MCVTLKNAIKPERKLYQDLKKNTCCIKWNRIENLSLLGMPDVLGYNTSGHFFTVELKVARGNKVQELVAMGHGPWTPTDWIQIQKTFELVA